VRMDERRPQMAMRVKARDLLIVFILLIAVVNLSSKRAKEREGEEWAGFWHRRSAASAGARVRGDGGSGLQGQGQGRGTFPQEAPREQSLHDSEAKRKGHDHRTPQTHWPLRHGDGGGGSNERDRNQHGGGGGGGQSPSAAAHRATASSHIKQQTLGDRTSALVDGRNDGPEAGQLIAAALTRGIPDEHEVVGVGAGGGTSDSDTSMVREPLWSEADVTDEERAAEATILAAATAAAADREVGSGGNSSSSVRDDRGDGGSGGGGEGDRATRSHKLHPDKYDRLGQIRESFLLRHLPKAPLTCPKIKGPMPNLNGLPVMLTDMTSNGDVVGLRGYS